jgi:hypothetical protein
LFTLLQFSPYLSPYLSVCLHRQVTLEPTRYRSNHPWAVVIRRDGHEAP